jgi:hypothetical protein
MFENEQRPLELWNMEMFMALIYEYFVPLFHFVLFVLINAIQWHYDTANTKFLTDTAETEG